MAGGDPEEISTMFSQLLLVGVKCICTRRCFQHATVGPVGDHGLVVLADLLQTLRAGVFQGATEDTELVVLRVVG